MVGALGVYWLALIHQLGAQWSVYDQYSYGWAVPFLCLYLFWQRSQASESRSPQLEAGRFQVPASVLYLLLVLCVVLYVPTRLLHEANPIWRLTSLLWAVEVIVITLCALCLATSRGQNTQRFSNFIFPTCFFLVAVPWPSGVETFLVQFLTRWNVSATIEVLGWLNIPALQHGNVIELSSGSVGVNEACSGIRSFQATLMIALFFGELFRLQPWRRVFCVGAGFFLSFIFNLCRTTLLSVVAARSGTRMVASWHDPASITILVACFLSLWILAGRLKSKAKAGAVLAPDGGPPAPLPEATNIAAFPPVKWIAVALVGWFMLVEAGTESWYRRHENSQSAHDQWAVRLDSANPTSTRQAIPENILAQFRSDESLHARWQDEAGNAWQLYYFRWLPAHSLKSRVATQLAKTHGPEKCLPAIGMVLKSDLGAFSLDLGGFKLVLQQFLFVAGDRPIHVFYGIYEDSTGSLTLANRRQGSASRVAAALAGSRNLGQRFLEVAVAGIEDPVKAQAALRQELQKWIVPQSSAPGSP